MGDMAVQPAVEIILAAAALSLLGRDLYRAWADKLRRPMTLVVAGLMVVLLAGTLGGRAHPSPWWAPRSGRHPYLGSGARLAAHATLPPVGNRCRRIRGGHRARGARARHTGRKRHALRGGRGKRRRLRPARAVAPAGAEALARGRCRALRAPRYEPQGSRRIVLYSVHGEAASHCRRRARS